ncbi:MAG: universal stress protein, partial [Desulfobacteraceae bacterium]|nr:universal stress protein [Desulfobacteraceae bacterium]
KPREYVEIKAEDYMDMKAGDYKAWNPSDYFELQKSSTSQAREKRKKLLNRLERQLAYMVPEESQNWCTPSTILLEGEPYKELIRYAKHQEMDMIVLGVRGHSLLEKLLVGSTTNRVINLAGCSVLSVRQI